MTTSVRPVRNRPVFLSAYKKWCNGKRQTEIVEESGVTSRTVERWVSQFKELPKSELDKDRKFLTLKMHISGISWRDADDLMDWAEKFSIEHNEYPTSRQTIWFWRLSKLKRGWNHLRVPLVSRIETHELETLLKQPTTETEEELSQAIRSFQRGARTLPTPGTRREHAPR